MMLLTVIQMTLPGSLPSTSQKSKALLISSEGPDEQLPTGNEPKGSLYRHNKRELIIFNSVQSLEMYYKAVNDL